MFRLSTKNKEDIVFLLKTKIPNQSSDIYQVTRPIGSQTNKEYKEKDITISRVNNYKDFLKTLKNESKKKLAGYYLFLNKLNSIIVLKSNLLDPERFQAVCRYVPENDKMYNFTLELLRLTSEENYRIIVSDFENNFSIISSPEILDIIFTKTFIESKNEKIFSKFKIPKKSGGMREIIAPHDDIKTSLRDLNVILQKVYDRRNNDFQIAYKKGKNVKTGALIHKDNKFVFNIDLKDFYPSCKKEIVSKYTEFLFTNTFNRKFVEELFLDVIFIDDGLFIGSPVSGTLANVTLSKPMFYLKNVCNKFNIKLSVYADDISFSSDKYISKKFIMKLFDDAFSEFGLSDYFKLNKKKSIGFSGCKRKITGVAINSNNEVTIPRLFYRDLRTQINHLDKGDMPIDIQVLRGKIAYALMIDDSGKMKKYLKKFESTILKHRLATKEKFDS